MYRIAICEDESNQLEQLCVQCHEILTDLEVEHEVIPFASVEELESALQEYTHFDLLCLDILMPGKNGMELAMEIRERDEKISILFITVSRDFLLEGYDVRPIQYLLKPVKQEALEKAIRLDLHLKHKPRTITLKSKGKTVVLSLTDIYYVESKNHGTAFFMEKEEIFCSQSLTYMETLLPRTNFCRCHNSFLINLDRVREVSSKEICLTDGRRLTIGRRYMNQFQSEFIRYLNRNGC